MLIMRALKHSIKYLKRIRRIASCGRIDKCMDEVFTVHRFAHDVTGNLDRYNDLMNRPVSSSDEEGDDISDEPDRPNELPPPPPTQQSQSAESQQPKTSRPTKIRSQRGRGRGRKSPSVPRWRH